MLLFDTLKNQQSNHIQCIFIENKNKTRSHVSTILINRKAYTAGSKKNKADKKRKVYMILTQPRTAWVGHIGTSTPKNLQPAKAKEYLSDTHQKKATKVFIFQPQYQLKIPHRGNTTLEKKKVDFITCLIIRWHSPLNRSKYEFL